MLERSLPAESPPDPPLHRKLADPHALSPGPPWWRRRRGLDLMRGQPVQHRISQALVVKREPALAFLGPSRKRVLESPEGAPAVQRNLKEFAESRVVDRVGELHHPIVFFGRIHWFDRKQPSLRETVSIASSLRTSSSLSVSSPSSNEDDGTKRTFPVRRSR